MGTRAITVTIVAVLGAACASATPVDIRTLLRRGAENEIALANDYEGERLLVNGRVIDLGYVQTREVVAEGHGYGYGSGRVTAREQATPRPYVMLAPQDGQPGSIFCWMLDDDDLVAVQRGARLRVAGYFYLYDRRGPGAVHLRSCRVVQ